jgi:hypothetical protein
VPATKPPPPASPRRQAAPPRRRRAHQLTLIDNAAEGDG